MYVNIYRSILFNHSTVN